MRPTHLLLFLALFPLACDRGSGNQGSADAAPVATTIADAAPLNATTLPIASVAAEVNPQKLPAYSGATGSVEGTIRVSGAAADATPADFSRCSAASNIYGHAFREGANRGLLDAVVAVTGYSNYFVAEKSEARAIAIEGCGFAQRTVTLTYGQRLEVRNLTKEFWTPKLEPSGPGVMMMAPPGGDAVKLYPKQVGYYHLVDHDRKWAVDDLYVFRHPLHTASGIDGTYRIDGIPVGKVKVNTLHPHIPNAVADREVVVTSGTVQRVDLVLVNTPARDAGAATDAATSPPVLH